MLKKTKKILIILLIASLFLCVGCTKNESREKGHILRNDIEIGDLAFLFDELEYIPGKTTVNDIYKGFKYKLNPEDVFDALGLPRSTTDYFGTKEYQYLLGNQYDAVTIKYYPDTDEIDFDPSIFTDYSEEYVIELWATGERTIDHEKYIMDKRFDITEEELSFIDEDTDSEELQQALGAPHYYIETYDVEIEDLHANVFVYELENQNNFKVAYFREGFIIRAWIEDSEGNQIEIYLDRSVKSYYGEE